MTTSGRYKMGTRAFNDSRSRGWDRRVALASGVFMALGSDGAKAYLMRRGWSPSGKRAG